MEYIFYFLNKILYFRKFSIAKHKIIKNDFHCWNMSLEQTLPENKQTT